MRSAPSESELFEFAWVMVIIVILCASVGYALA
jgi:hypothetical protein